MNNKPKGHTIGDALLRYILYSGTQGPKPNKTALRKMQSYKKKLIRFSENKEQKEELGVILNAFDKLYRDLSTVRIDCYLAAEKIEGILTMIY